MRNDIKLIGTTARQRGKTLGNTGHFFWRLMVWGVRYQYWRLILVLLLAFFSQRLRREVVEGKVKQRSSRSRFSI